MQSQKILVITGQTGTGKTSLALECTQVLNGELISADSRQVYNKLTIGTGKADSNDELQFQKNTWYLQKTPIHGVNLITIHDRFSAGEFAEYAENKINEITERKKLPIIVGGTAFYIKSILQPDETITIPQNSELRQTWMLQEKSNKQGLIKELQQQLNAVDPDKLKVMNESDSNNPRRLMRAVEVALWKQNHKLRIEYPQYKATIIGLHASKEYLHKKIQNRVEEMFQNGYESEVRTLIKEYEWDMPGMQTIGYREWKPYIDNQITKEQLKQDIVTAHLQYARKQLMYMRRFEYIQWINIEHDDWKQKALNIAKII